MRSYGADTNGIISQPAQGTLGTCLSAEKEWLPATLKCQSEEMLGAATSHSCSRPDSRQRSLWKLAYFCHFFLCLVYARQVSSHWAGSFSVQTVICVHCHWHLWRMYRWILTGRGVECQARRGLSQAGPLAKAKRRKRTVVTVGSALTQASEWVSSPCFCKGKLRLGETCELPGPLGTKVGAETQTQLNSEL